MIWPILAHCREEEVSSCQDQLGEFRSAATALTKWLEETNEKVPAVQPSSSEKSLERDLQIVTVSQEINKMSAIERVLFPYIFYLTALKMLEQKLYTYLLFMCFAIDECNCVVTDYSSILPKLPTFPAGFLFQLMTDGCKFSHRTGLGVKHHVIQQRDYFISVILEKKITETDHESRVKKEITKTVVK